MKLLTPFFFNFSMNAGIAFIAPYIVLYYQQAGFSGAQIGLLAGTAPLFTLVSAPLWTSLADSRRKHRLLLSLALLSTSAAVSTLPLLEVFPLVFLTAMVLNTSFAPIPSFADNATLHMLGTRKELYGRIRLGGTIGFSTAAVAAGLVVENFGLKASFRWGAVLMLLALVVSQRLVHSPAHSGVRPRGAVLALLREKRWQRFLLLGFACGLAGSGTINFLAPFMKSLGAEETTIGLAVTLGSLSEIPVFFFGNRLLKRFGITGLLWFSLTFTGLRLLVLGAFGSVPLILALQLLSGLTFAAAWMAGVAYVGEIAPPGLGASAQGLFAAAVLGCGSAAAGFSGGPLLAALGGHGLYLVYGATVLATLALVALAQRLSPAPGW